MTEVRDEVEASGGEQAHGGDEPLTGEQAHGARWAAGHGPTHGHWLIHSHATPHGAPRRRVSDRLTVGFLHLGEFDSGVRRSSVILADAAALRTDLTVVQAGTSGRDASLADLRRAARRLRVADVVHIQGKPADWGRGYRSLAALEVFLRACGNPVVVTLHDVYPRRGLSDRWLRSGVLAVRRLGLAASSLVVHGEEERARLAGLVPSAKVAIVPVAVEYRPELPDREASKRALGLEGRRVITLLGHITRRKGHRLVLEALPRLSPDVVAVFAGSPMEGREAVGRELEALAADLGVADRAQFAGFVPDDELEAVLAATDLALCPFRDMSASGAVSTWISTGRPILASDLPAFREYNALVPGGLRIFSPYTAEALADAVTAALGAGSPAVDPNVDRLRDLLATPHMIEHYLELYRAAVGRR